MLCDFFVLFYRPEVLKRGKLIQNFEQTGSVEDVKKSVHARTARTTENIAAARERLTEDPSTSTRSCKQKIYLPHSLLMTIKHKVRLPHELKSLYHSKYRQLLE